MQNSVYGRFVGVVACFLCLCSLASWSQSTAEELFEAGQKALQAGDYARAQEAYEQLARLSPAMAEVHANLGLIYFQERKYAQAVGALRQALKLRPSMENAGNLLAMALSETGLDGEALPGLEKCFRRSSDMATKRRCGLELQRVYTTMHRDRDSVGVALELTKLYPDDAEVLYHTGKIFGNYAYLTITRLADVAPDSVWRHLAAAEAFESMGSTGSAIAEYQQVLKIDPHRAGIHYRMGRTLLTHARAAHPEDTAEAAKEFEQELQIDPSNANAAYELAEMKRRAQQVDEARDLYEKALKSYPDFPEAHSSLAAMLLAQGQPEAALTHLEKAVTLSPNDPVAWYRLSQAQKALGNSEQQQKALARYRQLHDEELRRGELQPVYAPRDVTKEQLDPKEEK